MFTGSAPGPIVVGAVIDSSCLVWQQVCGETGSCWIYDNELFATKIVILGIVGCGVASIAYAIAVFLYVPPPPAQQADAETDEEQNQRTQNGNFEK